MGNTNMKALSVRAPWWWFILHAGKDIENREWPTRFRGTVYLHASKWWRHGDGMDDIMAALDCTGIKRKSIAEKLTFKELEDARGCIVGKVDIVDCVSYSNSPWFFGRYGFVLANPVAFKQPILCKGALGFFEVPADVQALLKVAA